ncbi:PTS transporter subunit EIIC [Streptomyces huiliensis]|uniref:PTS transporter subunit EIIC n=1 Tax=Streptomyces huiliensis TaxID=2876027 RepID=UPI001CC0C499|nr:PTS transporter subunit EIIC [Streptomyces huiliensis]MBZ4322807.1 PTS transporter subunit EIIC [Streptomyces huiliensis]
MPTEQHHLAPTLLPLLGGPANLRSVTHCMTRLRAEVADPALVRTGGLRATPGVLGVVVDGTAVQVVLGPGVVTRVAAALKAEAAAKAAEAKAAEAKAAGETAPARQTLRRVAQIFVPLIPALIGCGIIAGLAGLLANLRWLPALVPALNAVASGFMSLIGVFVGYRTAREFGGTPVLGGAVAAVAVWPGVGQVHPFGVALTPGQGGVLGALAAALLAVAVERGCRRVVPEALGVLVTPALTVLLPGLATLYGLMWAAGEVSTAVGRFADQLLAHGGAVAGFALGGLFLPLVMLGLHQALIPVHTTLIAERGSTVLLPILAMAGAGQVGAALAVYLRLPGDISVRRTVRSALPAGLLGIGEPLVYGVSLPLGRPFVTACVGGAFGGGFVGFMAQGGGGAVGATAIGPSGWALFPLLRGEHGPVEAVAVYAAGLVVGYAAGFVATYFFGFPRKRMSRKRPRAAPP